MLKRNRLMKKFIKKLNEKECNYNKIENSSDKSEEEDIFSVKSNCIEEDNNNSEDHSDEYSYRNNSYKPQNKDRKDDRKNSDNNNFVESLSHKWKRRDKVKKKNKSYEQVEKRNNLCSNTLSEINNCYSKLNGLISKYSISKVVQIILKLINGSQEDFKDNNQLFKKIKTITDTIENKNTITIMCLSILSTKCGLNENNNQKIKKEKYIQLSESQNNIKSYENDNDNDNDNDEQSNGLINGGYDEFEEKQLVLINGFHCKKDLLVFGTHYYNDGINIYSFVPRNSKPTTYVTAYCSKKYRKNCEAKIIVKRNSTKPMLFGNHNHIKGISKSFFYSKYPLLKDKEWKHVQIIKGIKKDKVIIQS